MVPSVVSRIGRVASYTGVFFFESTDPLEATYSDQIKDKCDV